MAFKLPCLGFIRMKNDYYAAVGGGGAAEIANQRVLLNSICFSFFGTEQTFILWGCIYIEFQRINDETKPIAVWFLLCTMIFLLTFN